MQPSESKSNFRVHAGDWPPLLDGIVFDEDEPPILGGFGEIRKAWEDDPGRYICVKLTALKQLEKMAAGESNGTCVELIGNEARVTHDLRSEYVPILHSSGSFLVLLPNGSDEVPCDYSYLEWIDGSTLEELPRTLRPGTDEWHAPDSHKAPETCSTRLPDNLAHEIIAQVADGLREAHEKDHAHRDLKPANVMYVTETEKIKIIDWGLAKKIINPISH